MKKSQTIDFPAEPHPFTHYVDSSIRPKASASSGLPLTFVSLTPKICIIDPNIVDVVTVVDMLESGTCTIQASQPGNSEYAAALPVTQSYQVVKNSQEIQFGALPVVKVGGYGFVTATCASEASGLEVTFSTSTPKICSVAGNKVIGLAHGTCIIHADQPGNFMWEAAPTATLTFTI